MKYHVFDSLFGTQKVSSFPNRDVILMSLNTLVKTGYFRVRVNKTGYFCQNQCPGVHYLTLFDKTGIKVSPVRDLTQSAAKSGL